MALQALKPLKSASVDGEFEENAFKNESFFKAARDVCVLKVGSRTRREARALRFNASKRRV
ncbi:MAG: hypothetical protein IJX36_08030, partial [Thermoguttaceae bacterium]|nr:hypothetical protein [Thermoguttaceae bacterium]